MDAKAKVVPYEVGGWYRQQNGEWVQLVGVASPGSHYECMYSIDADGQRIHRYTNRPGDYGRVTGSAHDYSDPRNIPPFIPESSMAELRQELAQALAHSEMRRESYAKEVAKNLSLLTGLEALAGECESRAESAKDDLNTQAEIAFDYAANQIRALVASAGLEGKDGR